MLVINIFTNLHDITSLSITVNNMLRINAECKATEIRFNNFAEYTILILITSTNRECRAIRTTSYVQGMACSNSILIAYCIYPICTSISTIVVSLQQICINKLRPIPLCCSTIVAYHVLNIHILLSCQHLWQTVYI